MLGIVREIRGAVRRSVLNDLIFSKRFEIFDVSMDGFGTVALILRHASVE